MIEKGASLPQVKAPPRRDVLDELWDLLTSPKLALSLIFAIVAACLAGALIIQAPNEMVGNAEAMRSWIERTRPRYGFWTDVFGTLGIFWVFKVFWFRALLGLLAINTVFCTLDRLPGICRHVFRPKLRPADGLFERGKPRAALQVSGGSLESAASGVRQLLRRSGYRAIRHPEASGVYLYVDRFAFARFGTLMTHAALVLVLLGAVATDPLGYFEEQGFAVPVGTAREVGHDTGLAVYVEDFADEYYPSGQPKDYRSELILYERGQEVQRATVRVNEPLAYGGVRIHQSYYGQSAVVSVSEPGGQALFDGAVPLTWRSNDGDRPVGYFSLSTRDLRVYLVGTAGENDPLIHPGELRVEAYQGKAAQPAYAATLTQRQPLMIAGLQFRFHREIPFTGLRVVRDPGAPIVWVACALLIVGLVLTFYFPHRRLWIRLLADGAITRITLVGAGRETADEVRRLSERFQSGLSAQPIAVSNPPPDKRVPLRPVPVMDRSSSHANGRGHRGEPVSGARGTRRKRGR